MNEFENSKVKDICYHGTNSMPFTILDDEKIHKNPEDGDPGYFGWGFYLTNDREYAEEFGDTILEFKVNIQNPFDFSLDSYDDLVDFIFKDCDKLKKRVWDTLYTIHLIGEERGIFFPDNNSEELKQKCIELYNKYRDSDVSEKCISELKQLMSELAQDEGNWLNGLFFFFGKELYNYFTSHGYDGVIAGGGKEIVVYKSKQLKSVADVKEDLELDVLPIPDWEDGSDEYTKKIDDDLKNNPDVTNYSRYCKIYPLRLNAVWYNNISSILKFIYKNAIEVEIYAGGEIGIYEDEQDSEGIFSVQDLEDRGIYTDENYDDFMNDNDIWGRGLGDNNTAYFGFIITPLKNNPEGNDYYHYDLGYDDYYYFDNFLTHSWFSFLFEETLPEFMEQCPEYFEEKEEVDDVAQELFELIPEPYNDYSMEELEQAVTNHDIPENIRKVIKDYLDRVRVDNIEESVAKKHLTKSTILNDVIKHFGYVTSNKLTDAVYLLPNGKILDTKGDYEKSQHENVAKYISDKYNIFDIDENDGSKFMEDISAMRITPWIPAIVIPENVLTEDQEEVLFEILNTLSSKVSKDSPLMVSSKDGQQIEYTKIKNPEDIITSILGYQIIGILKEKLTVKGSEMKFLKRIRG